MADFPELFERLLYAQTKAHQLNKAMIEFIDSAVRYHERPSPNKPGITIVSAELMALPPIDFRIEAGQIANELRSILDAAACERAEANCGDSKNTYFPISKTDAVFLDDGRRKMKKLSASDQDYIASLKPWGGGNPTLFPLHEADRVRKHSKLLGCDINPKSRPFGNGNTVYFLSYLSGPNLMRSGEIKDMFEYSPLNTTNVHIYTAICYTEPECLKATPVAELLIMGGQAVFDVLSGFPSSP